MDVKTRKILYCNGSFHVNSDIDRLYTRRRKGGRDLNPLSANITNGQSHSNNLSANCQRIV